MSWTPSHVSMSQWCRVKYSLSRAAVTAPPSSTPEVGKHLLMSTSQKCLTPLIFSSLHLALLADDPMVLRSSGCFHAWCSSHRSTSQ